MLDLFCHGANVPEGRTNDEEKALGGKAEDVNIKSRLTSTFVTRLQGPGGSRCLPLASEWNLLRFANGSRLVAIAAASHHKQNLPLNGS